MRRLILSTLVLCSTAAFGQTTTTANSTADAASNANASSQSGVMTNEMGQAASMQMGNITFGNSKMPDRQRIHTTPNVYTAPSMFGGSNNCGKSNTLGVGVTGFGIGGSMAGESVACNAREDTATAYRLGYQEVAVVRFFCFGEEANRLAYEAAGHACPDIDMLASGAGGMVGGAEPRPVNELPAPQAVEPQAGDDTSGVGPAMPEVAASSIVVTGFIDLNRDIYGNVIQAQPVAAASIPVEVASDEAGPVSAASGPVASLTITETRQPAWLAAGVALADRVEAEDEAGSVHMVDGIDLEQLVVHAGVDAGRLIAVSMTVDSDQHHDVTRFWPQGWSE